MPRRKTVEAEVVTSAVTRSTRSASKPNAPAATHKRAASSRKKSEAVVETTESAASAARPAVSRDRIAELAYSYWEARGYQHGFAEADWLRAERDLLELA